jgi:hypothetical protein
MENTNFEKIDGLNIIPIKPDKNEKQYKKIHPYLFQSPYVLGLVSPRQTGKSTVISFALLHESAFGQGYYSKVFIFSPCIEQCSTSRFLRERYECDTVYTDEKLQNIINEQKKYTKADMPHICVIVDDAVNDASMKKNSVFTAFVTKSRHYNADIIISVQHWKSIPKISRSNLTDLMIGYPVPNSRMLEEMAEEIGDNFENGKEDFYKYYYEATERTRYKFMNIKLMANPVQVYSTFSKRIK